MSSDRRSMVRDCARCGQTHWVDFRKLTRPVEGGAFTFTHWAPCPMNGEPIMMRIEAEEAPGA